MTSAWDKSVFVKLLLTAFDTIPELPVCAYLPLVSQAALESGWGATDAAGRNNFWNLSAGSVEHGRASSWPVPLPVLIGNDKEPDGKGGWRPIHQYWRIYDTPRAGVEDFLRVLNWPRYKPAHDALFEGKDELFIDYMGPDRAHRNPPIGGWYTLPFQKYLAGYRACYAEATILAGDGWKPVPHFT